MLYDVPLTGHIVVEANSPAQAIEVAQRLMDRSEGYITAEGPVEVYVP